MHQWICLCDPLSSAWDKLHKCLQIVEKLVLKIMLSKGIENISITIFVQNSYSKPFDLLMSLNSITIPKNKSM